MRTLLSLRPLWVTHRHVREVLPRVDKELERWERRAAAIPDPGLRREALASLRLKRFHCEGGSVFAAWEPRSAEGLVRFIVAFQTISDYLDNLCDRTNRFDPVDFRHLHRALIDAVAPGREPEGDYYTCHPRSEDGGYLRELVATCRAEVASLPSWPPVEREMARLVGLYVDLQVYKHVRVEERVPLLERWFEGHRREYAAFHWWEFAAATGSTLGVFALVTEAARRRPVESLQELVAAYFPWISALHILLDYFIDQEEDAREGDLNFVSFYPGAQVALERMEWITEGAVRAASRLCDAGFHCTVVEGLLGLYLSDPKVRGQGLERRAQALLRKAGWRAHAVYAYCKRWRERRLRKPVASE